MAKKDTTQHIAGKTIRLKLGDRFIYVSALTFKELAELQAILRDAITDEAVAATAKLPASVAEKHLDRAVEKRESLKIGNAVFAESLGTFAGIVALFYVAIKKHEPDITLDEVRSALTFDDPEELADVITQIIGSTGQKSPNALTPQATK